MHNNKLKGYQRKLYLGFWMFYNFNSGGFTVLICNVRIEVSSFLTNHNILSNTFSNPG